MVGPLGPKVSFCYTSHAANGIHFKKGNQGPIGLTGSKGDQGITGPVGEKG